MNRRSPITITPSVFTSGFEFSFFIYSWFNWSFPFFTVNLSTPFLQLVFILSPVKLPLYVPFNVFPRLTLSFSRSRHLSLSLFTPRYFFLPNLSLFQFFRQTTKKTGKLLLPPRGRNASCYGQRTEQGADGHAGVAMRRLDGRDGTEHISGAIAKRQERHTSDILTQL